MAPTKINWEKYVSINADKYLYFDTNIKTGTYADFVIKNSGEDDIMFVVKLTNYSTYRVKPIAGIVSSHNSFKIRVFLEKEKKGSAQDKFKIIFALVEDQLALL